MSKEKCVLVKESELKELERKASERVDPDLVIHINLSNSRASYAYSTETANVSLSNGLLNQIRRISLIIASHWEAKMNMELEILRHTKDRDIEGWKNFYRNKIQDMSIREFLKERRRLRNES